MLEREIKLAAPPGFRPPDFHGTSLRAAPLEPRRIDTVYHDTSDFRLARWGCSLRFRSNEGWAVKLPAEQNGLLIVRSEHVFPGDARVPPPEAVDLVRAYLRSAPTEPVVHMQTLRLPTRLEDENGRAVGELVVDDVSVFDGPRIVKRFREIEVEVADDVSAETLELVLERLRAAGAGALESMPKYRRGLEALALAPSELSIHDPGREATMAEVIRFAVASSVARLLRNDAGVRLGEDPEAVHLARVATRRLRSELRTFGPLIESDWAQSLRLELGWLARLLGDARDADVLLGRLSDRAAVLSDADRRLAMELLHELAWARERARDDLLAAMRGERYVALLDELVAAAAAPAVLSEAGRPGSQEGARALLAPPWARLVTAVEHTGDEPSDAELHAVRIETKRCRYAADAVSPALGKRARRFAARAAALQEVLGEHQDAVLAQRWLRKHGIESGGSFAYVAGELSAAERVDARRARAAWRGSWKALAKAADRLGL